MNSDNYIKLNEKPILSINNPYNLTSRVKIISALRRCAKKKIGNIFLIYPFKGDYFNTLFFEPFDAIYDSSNIDLFKEIRNRPNILYYSGYIYKHLMLNNIYINKTLFRTCFININFNDYKPEKFYLSNNLIFQSVKSNYALYEGYIFVNSWNDYSNGNYLEFDEKYGYSSINSFSKSILNISYQNKYHQLFNYEKAIIAIHVHAFYEELFEIILNKINLIPIKYNLFISTTSQEKKTYIEKCLNNLNIIDYNIEIFENKGRDVYPFLAQMRKHFKAYKYICHLHTKKSLHKEILGTNWSKYIYKNLIGNAETVLEIIDDFENNEKLGFILPETYYEIINGLTGFENINFGLHVTNKDDINYILKLIFHKYKIGEKIIFPVGNMFWAKTRAIYQILKISINYPDELGQINATIIHAIERIWLYLVKLNGYYYKTIFKFYYYIIL